MAVGPICVRRVWIEPYSCISTMRSQACYLLYVPLTAHSSQLLSWTLAFAFGESANEQGSIASVKNLGVFESSTSCGEISNATIDAIKPHAVASTTSVEIRTVITGLLPRNGR